MKKREKEHPPLFKCNTLATRFIVESSRESVSSISFPNSSSMLIENEKKVFGNDSLKKINVFKRMCQK